MSEPIQGESAAAQPGGGQQLASYGDRFIAFLIDFGIIIGVSIAVGILQYILSSIHLGFISALLSLALFAFEVAYFIYLWGVDNPWTGRGQTIGKKMMNIKIVKEDGSDIGVGDAVLRYIGYWVSSFVILLGFVWIFIDGKNQGWHDKIAKTIVVKT